MRFSFLRLLLCAATCLSLTQAASASPFTYNLTCVLNAPAGPCQDGPSFGTVTLTDSGVNQVSLFIDLGNPGIKFRDLMFNFAGTGFTDITSSKGEALSLSANSFSINPYPGDFDLGGDGSQGWVSGTPTPYSTTLTGVGNILTADMFNVLDTEGKVYVAVHLQNLSCSDSTTCTPGQTGSGSLKVGGVFDDGTVRETAVTPEPATFGLVGAALLGLGLLRRRK